MLTQREKDEWIAALRSGKYTQGKYYLSVITPEGERLDCCMGVLCDVKELQPTNYASAYTNEGEFFGAALKYSNYNIAFAPTEWELPSSILTKMNDKDGKSFNEIADWIEQNLETEG